MTRCNCLSNTDISSSVASITTNPGLCPPCPDELASFIAPVVEFSDASCSSDGISTEGTISEPSTACPDGTSIEYAVDGGPWTSILPDYNPNMSITISTRCNCDKDDSVSSIISQRITDPEPCAIPTMSHWMLMILGLILTSFAIVVIRQIQFAK